MPIKLKSFHDLPVLLDECRNMRVTPRVAQNLKRRSGSAIDGRTTQQAGYGIS